MADYAHLVLKRLEGELERRKPRGFGGNPQRNPEHHGPKLSGQVAEVLETYRHLPVIEGVEPTLILRVEVAGFIDEAEWARMDLVVLSEDENKTLLLFATDKELKEFQRRIKDYQGELPLNQKSQPYAALIEAIENVGTAQPEDRLGASLASIGVSHLDEFVEGQSYLLDVELFHPGDELQAQIFAYRLQETIKPDGGIIINTYIGESLMLCRIEANGSAISKVLMMPEVAVIELPPRPDLQLADIGELTADEVLAGSAPPENAVRIGVIDSGVNFGHPLLAYVMRGSTVGSAAWVDADEAGHGTSVASMAVYGDIYARAEAGDFDAPFWIASARVVDQNGDFPREITVPALMEAVVHKLHSDFSCRIFNISLGDPSLVYSGGRTSPWASMLDRLARELDLLFIVSTGNQRSLTEKFGEDVLRQYPAYLLDASSRIIEPATAANVLTVGSVAHANGLEVDDEEFAGVRPICGVDAPSPFTRTGPGVRGMIKPDLVDYGGNAVWDGPTSALVSGGVKASAGVWTFHHKPLDRLFRARSGTSFAAPFVAHKAGILLEQYPDAPANFLRAMLAMSGELPEGAQETLDRFSESQALMICGNGVPNVDHAVGSDESRVVFYANDQIAPDHFAVFEVPVPPLFQNTDGLREITVSLAFDPPVRHTRADYLGLTMGWRLLRGTNKDAVFDKFRKWEQAEGDPPEFPDKFTCKTFPGPTLREKGTLQCARFVARRSMATYGDTYYVAVWCRRRWAPNSVESQRFSLAVQLRHSADIALYQSLTLPVPLKA